jgi:prepilin-type N-terminal cleavage/methylation domain-containing protein
MSPPRARAFTLVELLVVIAIIGVMVAMTIPAIQASRETGRRNFCKSHLAQLMLALQSYDNAYESLPPGVVNPDGPIRSEPAGLHLGWVIFLLPYLDEQSAYRQVDLGASVYGPTNATARAYWPRLLICPSEPDDAPGTSSYAGCHHDVEAPIAADNHGVLFLNSHIRREDISDGVSHTLFAGEKRIPPNDLGWMSGTRATLRNAGLAPNDSAGDPPAVPSGPPDKDGVVPIAPPAAIYVGGFASAHSGGLNMGLGDASVPFIADSIDPKVWRQLAHRADGSLINVNLNE